MIYLVGYTGFVGSNLMNSFKFDKVLTQKILKAYGGNLMFYIMQVLLQNVSCKY